MHFNGWIWHIADICENLIAAMGQTRSNQTRILVGRKLPVSGPNLGPKGTAQKGRETHWDCRPEFCSPAVTY